MRRRLSPFMAFSALLRVASGALAKPFVSFPTLSVRAASNATVTANNQRVNGRRAFEYWRYELTANNSASVAWVGITNIGVYQDPN